MTEKEKQTTSDDVVLEPDTSVDEPELVEVEENSNNKMKALRDKLKACEAEKKEYLDELQRAKADFLNARKRTEEESVVRNERAINNHIEKMLPLCDSFYMAMLDKAAWSEAPEKWRLGVEGIHSQLQSILESYGVSAVDPTNQDFDPKQHEALSNVSVDKESDHHKVVSVIQLGFIRKVGDKEELIRPARVTVGEFTNETNN